jgi:hypothetical protein
VRLAPKRRPYSEFASVAQTPCCQDLSKLSFTTAYRASGANRLVKTSELTYKAFAWGVGRSADPSATLEMTKERVVLGERFVANDKGEVDSRGRFVAR